MMDPSSSSRSRRAHPLMLPLLLLAACCLVSISGQQSIDSRGNEFILSFLQNGLDPSNVELHLTTASLVNVSVDVEYPVGTFFGSTTVQNGKIEVFPLPISAAQGWIENAVNANSVRVVSSSPTGEVGVYMVNREEFTSDAALALPLDAINTKYIIIQYVPDGFLSQFVATAAFDNTTVTIVPTATLGGGRVAGVPFVVILNRGDSFFAEARFRSGDLTGSIVESTRPVVVVNGHECSNLPVGVIFCDHYFEVAHPVQSWGTTLLAAPLPERDDGTPYRMLASEDETTITIAATGVETQVVTLNAGQFYDTPFYSEAIFVQSDKPAFAAQFMTGSQTSSSGTGDPSMGNVIPSEQFLTEYTFATVGNNQFDNHWLSIIANDADISTLLLDGILVNSSCFEPVSTSGWSSCVMPLTEGTHTSSSVLFGHGITVEGYAADDSYLYPGGAQFSFINSAGDSIPPVCTFLTQDSSSITAKATDDGSGAGDDDEDGTEQDTGIFSVNLNTKATNLALGSLSFIPGDPEVTFSVAPVDPSFSAYGIVTVSDGAGNICTLDIQLIVDDSDGILDAEDQCQDTATGAIVFPTGRPNAGCSVDQLCPCDRCNTESCWVDHQEYIGCVLDRVKELDAILGGNVYYENSVTIISAGTSGCGNPGGLTKPFARG